MAYALNRLPNQTISVGVPLMLTCSHYSHSGYKMSMITYYSGYKMSMIAY